MEVIVMESAAFQELKTSIDRILQLNLQLFAELKMLKNDRWMSVDDICEYTGFSAQWVRDRKYDFGYFQEGKDMKFLKSNVDKYIASRSEQPKKPYEKK